jgi:hypothetical protein
MTPFVAAIRRTAQFRGGKNTHTSVEIRPRGERGLTYVFMFIRLAHLTQGAVVFATGYMAYVHPNAAAALLAVAVVESAWIVWRLWVLGTGKPVHAVVDAIFGVVGLLVAAYAITPSDRTTSFNWMLPYSVGGGVLIALCTRVRIGLPLVLALAATYLVSVTQGLLTPPPGSMPTAVVNVASYPLFYGVGLVCVLLMRHYSRVLDGARQDAIDQSRKLAAEMERANQYRLLHDDALQILEYIASTMHDDPTTTRVQAALAARRLRLRMLTEHGPSHPFAERLNMLSEDFEARGLKVEVVVGDLSQEPTADVCNALCDAASEAMNNVLKHAGTTRANLHVAEVAAGVQIVVRDHGKGFAQNDEWRGFGVRHSIEERLNEVGGRAEIWSNPGRGTRVTLWAPA